MHLHCGEGMVYIVTQLGARLLLGTPTLNLVVECYGFEQIVASRRINGCWFNSKHTLGAEGWCYGDIALAGSPCHLCLEYFKAKYDASRFFWYTVS